MKLRLCQTLPSPEVPPLRRFVRKFHLKIIPPSIEPGPARHSCWEDDIMGFDENDAIIRGIAIWIMQQYGEIRLSLRRNDRTVTKLGFAKEGLPDGTVFDCRPIGMLEIPKLVLVRN